MSVEFKPCIFELLYESTINEHELLKVLEPKWKSKCRSIRDLEPIIQAKHRVIQLLLELNSTYECELETEVQEIEYDFSEEESQSVESELVEDLRECFNVEELKELPYWEYYNNLFQVNLVEIINNN